MFSKQKLFWIDCFIICYVIILRNHKRPKVSVVMESKLDYPMIKKVVSRPKLTEKLRHFESIG